MKSYRVWIATVVLAANVSRGMNMFIRKWEPVDKKVKKNLNKEKINWVKNKNKNRNIVLIKIKLWQKKKSARNTSKNLSIF